MTNFEKFKNEVLGCIEGNDDTIAVVNGTPKMCEATTCDECELSGEIVESYTVRFVSWLYQDADLQRMEESESEPEDTFEEAHNEMVDFDGEQSCEDCDFEHKGEDEYPCVECKERYTLKFKPKTELKPCPFCGGEAERRESPGFHNWWVICKQCHTASVEHTTAEGAAKAWNRRAD